MGDNGATKLRETRAVRACAIFGVGVGILALLAWAFGAVDLTQLRPGWPPIYPRGAVWLVGLGVALLAQLRGRERLARVICAFVILGAVLTVVQFTRSGVILDRLDSWWVTDAMRGLPTSHPGRPALPTAFATLALAVLVLLVPVAERGSRLRVVWGVAQAIAVSLPLLALAGYGFTAFQLLSSSVPNGMSVFGASATLALAAGALLARPDLPVASMLLDRPDRVTVGRLVLLLLGLPVAVWFVRTLAAAYVTSERDSWVIGVLVATVAVAVGVYALSSRQQHDLYGQVALRDEAEAERVLLRTSADALLDPQVLLDSSGDANAEPRLTIADANSAAVAAAGTTRAGLVGRRLDEGTGLAIDALAGPLGEVVATGEPLFLDAHLWSPGPGQPERIHDVRAVRVPVGRVSVTWRDVTDERLRGERLADSERRYRLLAAHAADVVAMTRSGVLQFVSPSMEGALGWQPGAIVGHDIGSLTHPDERDLVLAALASVEGGTPARARFRLRRADGDYSWVEGAAAPLDGEGRLGGAVSSIRVVDDQVRTERALRRARSDAEVAAEAKSAFLANMSHEIRTPLTAVLGLHRLLLDSGLDARQRDHAERAQASARSLLEILNDILDFSKIEAGALELHPAELSLDALLGQLGTVLAANAGDRPVELLFDVAPGVPDLLIGDELRLRQVLLNLCGNALKFTAAGHVRLRVAPVDGGGASADGERTLLLEVEDTGIGMSEEARTRVTESFTQATPDTARTYGGTGLGLSISTRLLELMGSELEVTSTPGVGSTFGFRLTLPVAASTPPAAPEPGRRAALVGGSDALREVVASACAALGWSLVPLAADGTPTDEQPDVVLVDLTTTPDEPNALRQVADRIRRSQPGADRPRVVGLGTLTAVAALDAEEAAVLDASVVKPFTPAGLRAAATRPSATATPATPAAGADHRLAGVRVLLVEDNDVTRAVATEMLQLEGADVLPAENGRVAVDAVLAGRDAIDVVLMDQHMPVLDGLVATREIRGAGHDDLPIIAITANALSGDRNACLAAGMDDFVGKPFDLDELVECIRHWVDGARERRSSGASTARTRTPEPTATVPDLDHEAGLSRLGGQTVFYGDMLGRLLEGLPARVAEVDAAVASGDGEAAARHAHALSGAAVMLGATRLGTAARRLEKAAVVDTPPAVSEELSELHLASADLDTAVRRWRATVAG